MKTIMRALLFAVLLMLALGFAVLTVAEDAANDKAVPDFPTAVHRGAGR